MKVLLFAILDHSQKAEDLLRRLSKEGYNGTVIPTSGLHHVLPKFGGEAAAVSLAMLADDMPSGQFTLFVVIDESKVEALKDEIREETGGFTKVRGGMFVLPVASFEGSF